MKPYTYLIGWKLLDLWYYGVRYAKDCDPSDLWVKYFTSSKKVAILRIECGEPDIVEIRRIFSTPVQAKVWEERVLCRMNAVKSRRWLNQCNQNKHFCRSGPLSESVKLKMSLAYRPPKSVEHRRKLGISSRSRPPFTQDHKKKLSSSATARWSSAERLKQSDTRRGKLLSDEHKQKISIGGRGRVVSEETRTKQSIAIREALRVRAENKKLNSVTL